MDTIEGGKWLPDQELAWTLVIGRGRAHPRARERARLLLRPQSRRHRPPEGVRRARPSTAPCTRAISPASRSSTASPSRCGRAASARLEEHRAVELVTNRDGRRDRRRADDRHAHRRVRVRAGAGGAARDRRRADHVQVPHALRATRPATAWRWRCARGSRCATWRWCSSIRRGCSPGRDTRMTGTVLEEGLRGSGGYLLNGARERFMQPYDPEGERATRDIVSRAIYEEMRAGRVTPHGGVYISMGHLGPEQRAQGVQGHGRALRRLRLRSRGRPGRSRADRALHDGRRRVRRGLHDRAAGALRRGRGHRAACTARTGSAATASPTRPCSAASRATSCRAGSRPNGSFREPDAATRSRRRSRAARAPLGKPAGRPRRRSASGSTT